MYQNAFKTALVLSGGASRALAHLGVIEEMQRHDLKMDMIVGTSMGAVVGALYAYYGDAASVIERMQAFVQSDTLSRAIISAAEDVPEVGPDGFFNRFVWLFRKGMYYTHSIIRTTLVTEEIYEEIMHGVLPDLNIEDLAIPFAAITMDLMTGEEVVIRKGSLRKAVLASAAIPGILPAVRIHGRTLVDGGWLDNVPVGPAIAMGAHFVLGVDAGLDVLGLGPPPLSALENVFRCNEISRIHLTNQRKIHADVLLYPEIGPLHWANFKAIDRCVAAGRAAFIDRQPQVLRAMRRRRLLTLGGILHPARRDESWRHPFIFV
ncbi:MAG: patatin-like phospholipase family protein [Acidobacteriota bacterium]